MLKRYCNMCDKGLEETEKRHAISVEEQFESPIEEGEKIPPTDATGVPEGQKRMVSKYTLDVCDDCFQKKLAEHSMRSVK